jgi:hypothetical protein
MLTKALMELGKGETNNADIMSRAKSQARSRAGQFL